MGLSGVRVRAGGLLPGAAERAEARRAERTPPSYKLNVANSPALAMDEYGFNVITHVLYSDLTLIASNPWVSGRNTTDQNLATVLGRNLFCRCAN